MTPSRAVTFGGDRSQWADPHRRDASHRHGITRLAPEQTHYRAMPEPCATGSTDRPVATGHHGPPDRVFPPRRAVRSAPDHHHQPGCSGVNFGSSRRPAWRLPALEGGAVSETWPTRTSRWPRKISIRGPFRLCHDLGGPEPLINWSVHGGWWAGMRCSGADGVTATEPGLSVSGECRCPGLAFYPWS